jgi:imidazole glycerol-phosphate synthase subunit HisH
LVASIQILDYGSGNLFSIYNAIQRIFPDINIRISSEYLDDVLDGLVLPGVGSFTSAQNVLGKRRKKIISDVNCGMPLLGICLGMQLMFDKSEEGRGKGLQFFDGDIVRFDENRTLKIPHMGWNKVLINRKSKTRTELPSSGWAYFAHSYYPKPKDDTIILGKTKYGAVEFPSIVRNGNIFGTQYHPEKSGAFGFEIISHFLKSVLNFSEQ